MASQRFLIAPYNSGLQKNLKEWLIPDDAFSTLQNMFIYRGRIRKRVGSFLVSGSSEEDQLNSRVRIDVGTTDANGDLAGTVPGAIFKIGQLFSCGDEIFTVNNTGTPATMLTTGSATTRTYNTNTGAFDIQGSNATETVYFYPAEPIMGIFQYGDDGILEEQTYVFDTQFSYLYLPNVGWDRFGTAVWTGTDSDFFWSANYRGTTADDYIIFVSNFVTADGIQYYDGSAWATLNPTINAAGDTIETAKIIMPFKDRLIFLNTVENIAAADTNFVNRCRFSQNGNPLDGANGWLEDTPGRGGYIDAPTKEQIVTAEFLKDRLIVYFESSTWELVYTGNEILPFRWQQINTELGAESTFSIVPFDKVVIGVGNVGVHACNGANVERIDDKIPDSVFDIHNENKGVERVHGIRDYFTEMIYWTFPSEDTEDTFPRQLLIFNYRNGSWAFWNDSITTFGYFSTTTDEGPFQSQHRHTMAGNQEGFLFLMDPDTQRNAPSLQITDINTGTNAITVIDHNIKAGDFIAIENVQGTTVTNDVTAGSPIFKVDSVTTTTITPADITLSGTYTGGGTIALVSKPDIVSKEYNFFIGDGRNVEVTNTDFYLDKTTSGEFSIDYFASSATGALGTVIVETRPYDATFYPLEATQQQVWHRAYIDSEGYNFSIQMYFSDAQMIDDDIAWSSFVIHAIMFHASPTRDRLA